ncbi:MAG TPA: heme ABC transporter permease [Aestuariivirga sp.]|nr:heme ABC transporter permease [Aestuariivirga sp.]
MQYLANPTRFTSLVNAVLPYIWAVTVGLFVLGLYGALFTAPADYQQGETVRIMYVHVPAAWMALFVYTVMALASAVAIVFRHPLADAAAKVAAPIGAVFCFLALVTGSLWGRPIWNTWWVWDARLTSMFVLFLLYVGYMAVWQAIDEPHRAAMVARVVALMGFINVPIVKFSVNWWNSLHQDASVFRLGGPSIAPSMLWPLLVMGLAYTFLFIALQLVAMRSEIAARKLRQLHITAIGDR